MMLIGDLVIIVVLATILDDFLGEVQASNLIAQCGQLLSEVGRATT